LLGNGDLDPGFGSEGKAIVAIPASNEETGPFSFVYGLATDQDSRIVLSGSASSDAQVSFTGYVARLSSSGALDSSFGDDGVVRDPYRDGSGSSANAVVSTSLPDGSSRLISVGSRRNAPDASALVIARHLYDDMRLDGRATASREIAAKRCAP
jgi:hypothetical protein